MEVKQTERGFNLIEFKDFDGIKCRLQESSLATEPAIWLGCSELGLQHLVHGEGWQPVDLPPRTIGNTAMHLTQAEVHRLLPYLLEFALYGTVGDIDNETDATRRLTEGFKTATTARLETQDSRNDGGISND